MTGDAGGPVGPSLSNEAASDVRTVAKGGAIQIVGQFTHRFVTMFFASAATRILELGGYGLFRQVAQVLTIAGQLSLAGFNYAAMRFISKSRATGDHAGVRGAARVSLTATTITSAIVFTTLVLGADSIARLFEPDAAKQDELARLWRIGAAYIPLFAYLQVLRYCTQAYKTMVPSVVVGNIVQPVTHFLLGLTLLLTGFAVTGAVTSLVVSVGVAAAAAAWAFARILTEEERRSSPRSETRAMVRFALPQAGASLLGIQSLGLGILLLGMLSDDTAVGAFGVALALQAPGGIFLSGIVNIWAPVVSDLHEKGEIARLGSLYQTITRWVATFSFPIFAVLICEPDLFAEIFAGESGLPAAPIVAILAAGNFFYTGTGPTGYVLSMTGRPGVNFANSLAGVVLYVLLGLWIVPEHGVVGMAVVDAIVTALVNSARVIEARILVGVQPFGRSFLKPVGATLVGVAVVLLWRLIPGDQMWLEFLGVCVAGLFYFGTLRALGLDDEERYVWDQIRKRALKGRARRSSH